MKNIFFILLISFVFVQCSYKSILSKETQALIPPNANKVIISTEIPNDSLFILVSHLLVNNNFRIFNSDKEIGYINTDGKFVGEATMMRLNIKIIKDGELSKLISTADWAVDLISSGNSQSAWKQASKEDEYYSNFVFDKMVLFIQEIPHTEIQYIKE